MSDFDELDRILGTVQATSLDKTSRQWIEDQYAANLQMDKFYEDLGLKSAKYAWAKSPRVIHEAIEMLRTIHNQQRHVAIDALTPYNPDILRREAQKTLLEAIIDKNLTVTFGAPLAKHMPYDKGSIVHHLGLLPGYLRGALRPLNLGKNTAAAGWDDACLYSVGLPSSILQDQTFCVLPYMHLCWMCSPGSKVVTSEATVWTWGDGYQAVLKHPKEEEPLTLDGDSQVRMQTKDVKQLTGGSDES